MTRVGDFSEVDLARRLRTSGVNLRTGAFTTRVRVYTSSLVSQFADLYQDYPIDDRLAIFDFELTIGPPHSFRRFGRPKVQAYIEGEAPFHPLPARLAYPMMESALNWCICQRVARYLLVHAAVVERGDCAVIMPAPSGSGKSTLCAALVCQGWRLLSDEIAIIRPSDGRLIANPRPVGLKNESIQAIRDHAPEAIFGVRHEGTVKGTVAFMRPPTESVARLHEVAMPKLIVFPTFRARSETKLERMGKAEGFMELAQNSINYRTSLKRGFESLAGMIEACDIYKLTYGNLEDPLRAVGELHRMLSPDIIPRTDPAVPCLHS